MKSVLISVRPKWCELIASGKKRIEVRKTCPKIETPFKCYIYKSFGKRKDCFAREIQTYFNCGKVIGEFVCDKIVIFEKSELRIRCKDFFALAESCVRIKEMRKYIGNKKIAYGWHISDLKIYDNPKELGEFGNYKTEWIQWYHSDDKVFYPLTRPPQSWCYVEEI